MEIGISYCQKMDKAVGLSYQNFFQEFVDKDSFENVYSFRGLGHTCTSAYYIENGKFWKKKYFLFLNFFIGDVVQISSCQIDEEFDGVNHQTSHNGVYKVKVKNVAEDLLEEIGGIRIILGGSYTTYDFENEAESVILENE